jgi:hypothetical protein
MSAAEQQELINAIHEQLDNAISYNLYTGIAYGALPFHVSSYTAI